MRIRLASIRLNQKFMRMRTKKAIWRLPAFECPSNEQSLKFDRTEKEPFASRRYQFIPSR